MNDTVFWASFFLGQGLLLPWAFSWAIRYGYRKCLEDEQHTAFYEGGKVARK